MIAHILIPTDFSPAAWQATKIGMEMAQINDAELNLLHIVPTVSKFSNDKSHKHLPENMEELKSKMNDFSKGLMNGKAINIQNFVLPGNVADTVLDFIQNHEYDLVILGVNSDGFSNELGSHSSFIIEKCGVPVLIVPNTIRSNGALAS
ncbi:MAG: universal stress protein [Bacteroidota bacterium]